MRADHWRNEQAFVPADLGRAAELQRAILDAGYSPTVAGGIIGWLLEKSIDGRDSRSLETRTRYRAVLRDLESRGWTPGGRLTSASPG